MRMRCGGRQLYGTSGQYFLPTQKFTFLWWKSKSMLKSVDYFKILALESGLIYLLLKFRHWNLQILFLCEFIIYNFFGLSLRERTVCEIEVLPLFIFLTFNIKTNEEP